MTSSLLRSRYYKKEDPTLSHIEDELERTWAEEERGNIRPDMWSDWSDEVKACPLPAEGVGSAKL